jgi:hypothetical protein
MRLDALRPDIGNDEDAALTSLAQFDVLYCITSIGNAGTTDSAAFYTNFAPYRAERIEPVVARLLKDEEMRATLFPLGDDDLAIALAAINRPDPALLLAQTLPSNVERSSCSGLDSQSVGESA